MSYQNKLDEINEKLSRLQQTGGVSRPLIPVDSAFGASGQRLDEVVELLKSLAPSLMCLGEPTSKDRLLLGIEKKNGVDRVNALFDFFARFKGSFSGQDAARFNLIVADVFKERHTPAELLRLSERTMLPSKKRQRMTRLAEVLKGSVSSSKKLPEVIVIKNELEGYLNENQNERDYNRLVKNLGGADFEEDFERFAMLELGDILEPPVATSSDETPATVFGYLESVLEELFLMRREMEGLKASIASLSRDNPVFSVPAFASSPASITPFISADTSAASAPALSSDETFGSILEELSALKEDIRSALSMDDSKSGEDGTK